eukprot:TRINITY_DN6337_c0_g1_i1.p1 TRINITY_DN6337_c0_g1~~TRINITY_DN6337_c0_g1_i1.p1  ORF type:complete len:249 (-),score=64.43 TRINITY_DN6337_c0_g1_i1:38-784(-)
MSNRDKVLILFDVDGTLCEPRKKAVAEMIQTLQDVRKNYTIGIVGGSNLPKIEEQLLDALTLENFDYVFSENGTVAYKAGKLLAQKSVQEWMGQEKLNRFNRFVLRYLSQLDIPITTGTFIEHRRGMINISPIGRNCNQQERDAFEVFDKEHKIRENMIAALKKEFDGVLDLQYAIGGQISFDVFPTGWNKTFCLQYVPEFETVHFFGDKTDVGGNDHEIYSHDRVSGNSVKSYHDTLAHLRQKFVHK